MRSRTAKAARPRKRRKAASASSPSFVRLVRASHAAAAAIEVQVVGATIRVTTGFDVVLLREVIAALRGDAS